ncbi:PIN domain-containing protein [Candidatus Micrarchaeota archaeon]|nr:PIN domain-containing protein [Candidatus Micrarchaeota archaeon]
MKTLVIDTNAWIDYLEGDAGLKKQLDENSLETPMSVIVEVSIVLRRDGQTEEIRKKVLDVIATKSFIRPLEFTDAERISDLVVNGKLHFADALAYAAASEEKHFLTADGDFKGKPFIQWTR